jgi:uncharacterized protein
MDRRTFVGAMAATALAGLDQQGLSWAEPPIMPAIPKRKLGKTGVEVSVLIIGGVVGMQEKPTSEFDPEELADAALDAGINYFDTAAGYGGGQSELNFGRVVAHRRNEVFLATKTQKRNYDDAMREVEESLGRLQTDHLDLLQIHSVRKDEDFSQWSKSDGILKALHKLRDEKVIQFIGVTGHDTADAMLQAIEMDDFDTILTTFNPTEERRPFRERVIPVAQEKQMGVIAMKVMGGGNGALALGNPLKNDGVPRHDDAPQQASASTLIRYALGLQVSAATVGMASLEQLRINVAAARDKEPLNQAERESLESLMP